jgi:hypothetical protein
VTSNSRSGWFIGVLAVHGNLYDGHSLPDTLEQVARLS